MADYGSKLRNRGYFGIGIYHCKTSVNIGTLWRSAYIMGASFIFTIGHRYKGQASDTVKAYRHCPLFEYDDWEQFKKFTPYDCQIITVEMFEGSKPLQEFHHPQRAVYVLGAEDNGIPRKYLHETHVVEIPSVNDFCHNVSVAGSIVMYDRYVKCKKEGWLV